MTHSADKDGIYDRDGNPVQPLGWQGGGIDWEVYTGPPRKAVAYDEDVCVAVVTARTRLGLAYKMRRAAKVIASDKGDS